MNTRSALWSGAGFVIFTSGCFLHLLLNVLPAARESAQLEKEVTAAIRANDARGRAIAQPAGDENPLATEARAAARAEFLRGWLQARDASADAATPEAREQWAQEMAAHSGRSAQIFRALLPSAELPDAAQTAQFAMTRDLVATAIANGVLDVEFVVFTDSEPAVALERFGASIATRSVRIEYVASFESHQKFIKSLMRRRDRGPFYALDAMQLSAADAESMTLLRRSGIATDNGAAIVRASLDLRRVFGVAR